MFDEPLLLTPGATLIDYPLEPTEYPHHLLAPPAMPQSPPPLPLSPAATEMRLSTVTSPSASHNKAAPPIFAEDPPLPPIDLNDSNSIPFALRDVRSPSSSTISSGSWTDEPKQRTLIKQASLPVPCSPADAAPLPRRGRLPQAQVFVARPATPRGLSEFAVDRARLIAATRRNRPTTRTCAGSPPRMAPRCSSEVGSPTRHASLRKSSSGYNHGRPARPRAPSPVALHSPARPSSPRVNTPAPKFWKDAARFESADVYDAHITPPPDEAPQRAAGSLRHLSLQRDEAWVLPPRRDAADPAVLSFDSFRASVTKSNLARADDYVGFIEVAPTKLQLWRIKSRQFFGKFFGRSPRPPHTIRNHA